MEQQPRLPLWFLVMNWVLIAGAFVLGTFLGRSHGQALPEPQRSALELVYQQVMTSHVGEQDGHELLERAIAGMVKGLDPYSAYVPPRDAARYDESNSGHYEGVGAEMAAHGDAVVVHFPFAGGPADRAGLLPGDLLRSVDDTVLDTADERERAAEFVRGPADTDVRLGIERDGQRLDLLVRRDDVQRPCVRWAHLLDGEARLGYVYVADFHPGARDQLQGAIESLQAGGALRGLVIDLRYDGGGLLDECIGIANLFLRSGTIVTQQRRNKEVIERRTAKPEACRFPELPLVVLVSAESASASEVLTGALQDHGRALVVGEHTFGKGLVNTVYSWKGHDFRLKLTTGSYRTPNDRDIEGHYRAPGGGPHEAKGGIEPDVPVALPHADKLRIHAQLEGNEVPERHRAKHAAAAAKYGFQVPAPPTPATDAQLRQALQSLRERADAAAPGPGTSGR